MLFWLPTDTMYDCYASGLHRQCLFGGLRIGLYEPVKRFYMGERPPGEAPLYLKVAAGLTTGALAIAIASPTDLVKVGPLIGCSHDASSCQGYETVLQHIRLTL